MKMRNRSPQLKSLWIISLVAVLVTGVTFATLQSPAASLTGNTIESATADLRIGTSTSTFSTTRVGFDFPAIVPGGAAGPANGNTFYLKNYGTANLAIKAAVGPAAPSNINNMNLAKVYFHITRVDTPGTEQIVSLKSLVDNYTTGYVSLNDTINGGVIAQYTIKVSMDSDAYSGAGGSLSGIDLVFNGTGV